MSLLEPDTRPGALSRRRLLLGGAAALAGAAAAGCRPAGPAVAAGERLLTVWHAWGGVMGPRFEKIAAAFEKAHPGVRLRLVYTQNNLSTNQKFFTAVAAGTPPDVTFVDGPQVASWAEWGALEPLTERAAASGVRPDDYFAPTWRQNVYREQLWAMTYCADPNFGFAWNREAFRKAGLDPERPPAAIDELTEAADRLTKTEDGVIRQIGMIPWAQYGPANSIFTWGWAFGGEFYDDAARRITADHPRVVQALEWMITFAQRHDPARIASLQQGFGTAEQNPFYSGKLAMQCLHIGGIGDIERYAPDLDYGVTYIPAPPDGEARSSWVGGWCMSIPRGARNPDDAWEFIRWLCHSEEGTALVGRETGLFPGMRRSPHFAAVRRKRYYGDYVRILEESRHQRPVMPVQAFYMRELQRAVEAAVYGRRTPAEALAQARKNTQAELDLVLAGA
jgi:multiple sugar transport system substrate-binding protein